MSTRIRSGYLVAAVLLVVLLVSSGVCAAEKLKGFYSGSGGVSQATHRVVLVEFAADGSAIVEQTWVGKDPQMWHARWVKQGKAVTVTFDAVKDKPTPQPLLMKFNHGTLVPTSWDAATLGDLGPPNLMPFAGKNIQTQSVASCQGINARDPSQNCVTWSSGR